MTFTFTGKGALKLFKNSRRSSGKTSSVLWKGSSEVEEGQTPLLCTHHNRRGRATAYTSTQQGLCDVHVKTSLPSDVHVKTSLPTPEGGGLDSTCTDAKVTPLVELTITHFS